MPSRGAPTPTRDALTRLVWDIPPSVFTIPAPGRASRPDRDHGPAGETRRPSSVSIVNPRPKCNYKLHDGPRRRRGPRRWSPTGRTEPGRAVTAPVVDGR